MFRKKLSHIPRFYIDITLLIFAELIWATGVNFYSMLFPIYMKNYIADERIISLILGIGNFAGILALVGGYLSKRVSIKWLTVMCWAVTLPSPLILALSSDWPGFLAGQVIYNLTTMFGPAVVLYIFDYPFEGNKTSVYMIYCTSSMIAGLIGPTLGGILSDAFGLQKVLFISFALFCIGTTCTLFLTSYKSKAKSDELTPEQKEEGKRQQRELMRSPRLWIWLLLLMAVMPGYNITGSVLGIFASTFRGFTDTQIGLSYTCSAAYGIILTQLVRRWTTRTTPLMIVAILGLSCAVANGFILLPMGIAGTMILGIAIRGSGRTVIPFLQATLTESLHIPDKGLLISIFYAGRSVFTFLATSFGGVLYKIDTLLPFIVEGLAGVAWVVAFGLFTRNQKAENIRLTPKKALAEKNR